MHKTLWRPAIAMIELIFAIVIIGIVLLSAPQLVSTSTQSGYVAIQQEAINEAATRLNLILGFNWDENNTNETYIPTVLGVTNGNTFLDSVGATGKRAGTPTQSYRSFFRSDGAELNASSIGQDGGDLDDMDDFNLITGLFDTTEDSTSDYIETTTIRITSSVSYGTDLPSGGNYEDPGGDREIVYSPDFSVTATPTTNIKFISVQLDSTSTSDEMNKSITLNAFSANIGAYDLEERVYP